MQLSFILVEPAVPENTGAAARAIKTMGFDNLRLVNPVDHLSLKAKMLAHGANEILENAQIFNSLEEALQDIDFSVATTAKKRIARSNYIQSSEILHFFDNKVDSIQKAAIVFGREESGLTNKEVRLCNIASSIHLANPYPSVNLAQSVMIYAYELSSLRLKLQTQQTQKVEKQKFRILENKVKTILEGTAVENREALYQLIFEKLGTLGKQDIHLLLSISEAIQKKYT